MTRKHGEWQTESDYVDVTRQHIAELRKDYVYILVRHEDMPILTQALDALTQDAKTLLADENPLVVDKGQTILRQIHRIQKDIGVKHG